MEIITSNGGSQVDTHGLPGDVFKELREAHGEFYVSSKAGVTIAFRLPKRGEWKRFKTLANDDRKKSESGETLLKDCLLHPSRRDFDQVLDEKPWLAEAFAGELLKVMGVEEEAETRKV